MTRLAYRIAAFEHRHALCLRRLSLWGAGCMAVLGLIGLILG